MRLCPTPFCQQFHSVPSPDIFWSQDQRDSPPRASIISHLLDHAQGPEAQNCRASVWECVLLPLVRAPGGGVRSGEGSHEVLPAGSLHSSETWGCSGPGAQRPCRAGWSWGGLTPCTLSFGLQFWSSENSKLNYAPLSHDKGILAKIKT